MSSSIVILTAVAVFLIVILLLVSLLLYARKRLVPQGKVHLEINGEKDLEVEMGNSLLSTLAAQKIFLPSACGGKGSCGLCRVRVPEGGGSILPSEQGFFTRKEQADRWRLACQVKVRNDLKIQVPAAIFGIRKWECEVVSSRNVATFIREFSVKLPEGEKLNFR
ncbi:MAG: 2Fe-2S iron-sulfur cluster binding domain-containing protein, partial [Bacteroidales bacterium]|nr:2Fe-2S iron-sulfur cluster binding domain-containing protein [Bacteroidales bacterium]